MARTSSTAVPAPTTWTAQADNDTYFGGVNYFLTEVYYGSWSPGDDEMNGGGGVDYMEGGLGNDILRGQEGDDNSIVLLLHFTVW